MSEKNRGCKYCRWLDSVSNLVAPKEYHVEFFCTEPSNIFNENAWYDADDEDTATKEYIEKPVVRNAGNYCVWFEEKEK